MWIIVQLIVLLLVFVGSLTWWIATGRSDRHKSPLCYNHKTTMHTAIIFRTSHLTHLSECPFFFSAINMDKALFHAACSRPLQLAADSGDWSLSTYLHRSDPSTIGTLKRFPTSESVFGGASAIGGGSSGGWREVGGLRPPSSASVGINRPATLGIHVDTTSKCDGKKIYPMELLTKKCVQLIGYVESSEATESSMGVSRSLHNAVSTGPLGLNTTSIGNAYVRVGGPWNGDGQNSAVCLATIYALGILTEVRLIEL